MRLSRRQALGAGLSLASVAQVARAEPSIMGDRGRWLAGVSPLPGEEPGADWRAYAEAEDGRWRNSQARIRAMLTWATRELAPLSPVDHTVFYPFAGPDALHALALFANARRMVLVGLEPVGTLPEPGRVPAGFWKRLGDALGDVHRLTFFRTLEMQADFEREGVVSGLVATIVRMGGTVLSVQGTSAPRGVRIDWTVGTEAPRQLTYVQLDLANAQLQDPTGFAAALRGMAPYVTFIKAAMYLLTEARFSILRQRLLDDSSVVLQDDTGLPYRHFGDRWATRLFGQYQMPGAPYEGRFQPNLRAAYDARRPPALPFGIGYHVLPQRSNLLLASRVGGA
jgi:hypothetical protein